mmetsp:Transcript_28753/g.52398  ORF Transcript_28753/g.52398 Transcript_28753/m.52398 type:complete len:90 (-) Transcript_28753:49-318(-)
MMPPGMGGDMGGMDPGMAGFGNTHEFNEQRLIQCAMRQDYDGMMVEVMKDPVGAMEALEAHGIDVPEPYDSMIRENAGALEMCAKCTVM